MAIKKLPVWATADEAIKSPLIHGSEFIRFASIPTFVIAITPLIEVWMAHRHVHQYLPEMIALPSLIVSVPLQVAWVRLIIDGPETVSTRAVWRFGKVELQFMAAKALLDSPVALSVIIFVAAVMGQVEERLPGLAAKLLILLAVALVVVGVGCAIRLWFVMVELALKRYKGLRAVWPQTKGNFWRLLAATFLAFLPFALGKELCRHIENDYINHQGWMALISVVAAVFASFDSVAKIGALTLAYRFVTTEPSKAARAS